MKALSPADDKINSIKNPYANENDLEKAIQNSKTKKTSLEAVRVEAVFPDMQMHVFTKREEVDTAEAIIEKKETRLA